MLDSIENQEPRVRARQAGTVASLVRSPEVEATGQGQDQMITGHLQLSDCQYHPPGWDRPSQKVQSGPGSGWI